FAQLNGEKAVVQSDVLSFLPEHRGSGGVAVDAEGKVVAACHDLPRIVQQASLLGQSIRNGVRARSEQQSKKPSRHLGESGSPSRSRVFHQLLPVSQSTRSLAAHANEPHTQTCAAGGDDGISTRSLACRKDERVRSVSR